LCVFAAGPQFLADFVTDFTTVNPNDAVRITEAWP
jgi:hypothetical protein